MKMVIGGFPLARARKALVGAVAVLGLGAAPAASVTQYTDNIALSAPTVRLGFVKAMPEPQIMHVSGARAAHGTVTRHKASQAITKMSVADQECLAAALYYEARGEGRAGQMAVAEVVVRRAHTAGYPKSVCGVVYQGNPGGTTNCQFTWACNGDMHRGREPDAWSHAHKLARNIGTGKVALGDTTNHALFFHAVTVRPYWPGYQRTTQIGHHIFYKRIAGYRGPHIVRRHRTELAGGGTVEEMTPRGGVLLPDGGIQPAGHGTGLNIDVRPQMQTASEGDGA